MAGYSLYVISGIDGNFKEFNSAIEKDIMNIPIIKIAYIRSMSFQSNINSMRILINGNLKKCILLGWSIGGVAAAFLSDCINVKSAILINAFYKRSDILNQRNIYCDEEVCFTMIKKTNKKIILICGERDDKIPSRESRKIQRFYNSSKISLYSFPNAEHNLSSFPKGEIAKIINKIIIEEEVL